MTISQQVSQVLEVPIPPGHWEDVFNELDRTGKITQRVLKDLLIILCQKIEEMEQPDEPPTTPNQNPV